MCHEHNTFFHHRPRKICFYKRLSHWVVRFVCCVRQWWCGGWYWEDGRDILRVILCSAQQPTKPTSHIFYWQNALLPYGNIVQLFAKKLLSPLCNDNITRGLHHSHAIWVKQLTITFSHLQGYKSEKNIHPTWTNWKDAKKVTQIS